MTIADYKSTADGNKVASPAGFTEGEQASTVNNTFRQIMADYRTQHEDFEWVDIGLTPTRVSDTSFRFDGDVTTRYHVDRRLKITDGSDTKYAKITATTYSAPYTTVDISLDSGSSALTTNISSVAHGFVSAVNSSVDGTVIGAGALADKDTVATADIDNGIVSVEHLFPSAAITNGGIGISQSIPSLYEKLTATTLSTDSEITFAITAGAYQYYRLIAKQVILSASDRLEIQVKTGGSYHTTNYHYAGFGHSVGNGATLLNSNSSTGIDIGGGVIEPEANYAVDIDVGIDVYQVHGSSPALQCIKTLAKSSCPDSTGSIRFGTTFGTVAPISSTSEIDGIKLKVNGSATMNTGTVTLYAYAQYKVLTTDLFV